MFFSVPIKLGWQLKVLGIVSRRSRDNVPRGTFKTLDKIEQRVYSLKVDRGLEKASN